MSRAKPHVPKVWTCDACGTRKLWLRQTGRPPSTCHECGGHSFTSSRYVTSTADTPPESARLDSTPTAEPRYRLMRLCECSSCEGKGKAIVFQPVGKTGIVGKEQRCQNCRGESKTLDEIARCDTPADVGVALVTLALEGEFDGCPFGLIDSQGEPGLKWLVRPWVASPRNVSDAARTLAKSKGDKT